MAIAAQVPGASRSALVSMFWSWWAVPPLALACAACVVPWLLVHAPVIGFVLDRGFSIVCHQHPERSFFLFGGSVAVCARCLGIYIGAAVGLLIEVPCRLAWGLLLAAVNINLIDWLTELAGLHGNWMFFRFALGLTLGAVAAMLVVASIEEIKIPAQVKAA